MSLDGTLIVTEKKELTLKNVSETHKGLTALPGFMSNAANKGKIYSYESENGTTAVVFKSLKQRLGRNLSDTRKHALSSAKGKRL